jgi:hypothetical protein
VARAVAPKSNDKIVALIMLAFFIWESSFLNALCAFGASFFCLLQTGAEYTSLMAFSIA